MLFDYRLVFLVYAFQRLPVYLGYFKVAFNYFIEFFDELQVARYRF